MYLLLIAEYHIHNSSSPHFSLQWFLLMRFIINKLAQYVIICAGFSVCRSPCIFVAATCCLHWKLPELCPARSPVRLNQGQQSGFSGLPCFCSGHCTTVVLQQIAVIYVRWTVGKSLVSTCIFAHISWKH